MTEPLKALFCAFHSHDRLLRLINDFPQIQWTIAHQPHEAEAGIGTADILILNNRTCNEELGAALWRRPAPHLAWIHFVTAGVEKGLAMGLPQGVPVTHAAGANGPVMAEHAIALLLGCMRRFNDIYRNQAAQSWGRLEITAKMRGLEGMRICIVGLGAAGREIARKLRAFDADVIAISRGGSDPNISRVYPRSAMREVFAHCDAAIICTNSDASSLHMIGAAEIAALKPGGFIINVARGELIDEAALIAALQSGHLGGAGLDVTEEEPLPRGNALWSAPNIIISPHIAGGGAGEGGYRRQQDLFAENLRRLKAGEVLLNPVRMA